MITLHSLDQSRALRIVWLLEILGTPYRLQTYCRHPDTLLAPDELKAIHPLGKSPLLDDDGFILAESGAITDYLIQTYGNGRLMPERGSREYWQYQRWLHYAEGSLMPLLLLGLVFRRIESAPMPFFVKPLARKISGRLNGTREIEHRRVRIVAPAAAAAHIPAANDEECEDGAKKSQELFHHNTSLCFDII